MNKNFTNYQSPKLFRERQLSRGRHGVKWSALGAEFKACSVTHTHIASLCVDRKLAIREQKSNGTTVKAAQNSETCAALCVPFSLTCLQSRGIAVR